MACHIYLFCYALIDYSTLEEEVSWWCVVLMVNLLRKSAWRRYALLVLRRHHHYRIDVGINDGGDPVHLGVYFE